MHCQLPTSERTNTCISTVKRPITSKPVLIVTDSVRSRTRTSSSSTARDQLQLLLCFDWSMSFSLLEFGVFCCGVVEWLCGRIYYYETRMQFPFWVCTLDSSWSWLLLFPFSIKSHIHTTSEQTGKNLTSSFADRVAKDKTSHFTIVFWRIFSKVNLKNIRTQRSLQGL